MKPAVLFVRSDSLYKSLDCDAWDAERDALRWPGGVACVVHPPCRGWGCLRGLSKATEAEKALGPWAVEQVRRWGGVLEHPAKSSLFRATGMPRPGARDCFGGFTVAAQQWWFGHRAEKWTWFYIVGLDPRELPEMPYRIGRAERVITNQHGLRSWMPGFRSECTKAEREATPPALAEWLLEICRRIEAKRLLAGNAAPAKMPAPVSDTQRAA